MQQRLNYWSLIYRFEPKIGISFVNVKDSYQKQQLSWKTFNRGWINLRILKIQYKNKKHHFSRIMAEIAEKQEKLQFWTTFGRWASVLVQIFTYLSTHLIFLLCYAKTFINSPTHGHSYLSLHSRFWCPKTLPIWTNLGSTLPTFFAFFQH